MNQYMSKIITIDCDGVISATAESLLAYHDYQLKGNEVCLEDIHNHRFHLVPKFDMTAEESAVLRDEFYCQVPKEQLLPEEGALATLQELKRWWYSLFVITARIDKRKTRTHEWMDYYFPDVFEDIIFTNDLTDISVSKGEVSKRLWAEWHIDDHIEYAYSTAGFDISTLLFNKPRNQSYDINNDLITRVSWWDEALDHLS